MTTSSLLLLAAFAALAWFGLDALRAKEQALEICRRACRQADVQLLDETVALGRLSLGMRRGRLTWIRRYDFEFSGDGGTRWSGRLLLEGRRQAGLQMDHPEGVTIL